MIIIKSSAYGCISYNINGQLIQKGLIWGIFNEVINDYSEDNINKYHTMKFDKLRCFLAFKIYELHLT